MKLINIKELSEMIGVKKSTLYLWAKDRTIPAYRLNGILRFDPYEIEEWVRTQKVGAPYERKAHKTSTSKATKPVRKTYVRKSTGRGVSTTINKEIFGIIDKAIEGVRKEGYNDPQRENQTDRPVKVKGGN